MKILLVKPPVKSGQVYNVLPPLGLGYLATAARASGRDVEIIDAIRDGLDAEETVERILRKGPDVVGYQVFSYDVGMVKSLSAKVAGKAGRTAIKQIFGGPHPSGLGPQVIDDFPDMNYAVIGEGEKTFPALLDIIAEGGTPTFERVAKVPGLIKQGMPVGMYTEACRENDLDALGFPAWDLHPPKRYPFAPQGAIFRQVPFAPLIITRGCPFPCTFCAGHTLSGKKFRHRSVGHVIDEMKMLRDQYGVKEFHVLDDNFSLERAFFMEWLEAMIAELPGVTWCAPNGMRLDTLDPEVVRTMMKSGCYYVSVGIESGSDRILKHMRKGFTVADVREKVGMIRKQGLEVNGFFIIGYPEETIEDIEATIKLSVELDLSRAAFFNYLPLPGTPLFDALFPERPPADVWDNYFQYNAPFAPKSMSPKDVKRMQRKAHFEFYRRPSIVWRMLREIKSPRQAYWILKRVSKVFGAGADIIRTKPEK